MFLFITIVQTLIAAALVGVILMQRSEGGGLGVGGNPNGLMSARGAGDLLTRSTAILATLFVALSIVLAVMAANMHSTGDIDTSLQRGAAAPISDPLSAPAPAAPAPANGDPLSAAGAPAAADPSAAPAAAPAAGDAPAN
ncbi:preprotein translocase subunit SecG [Blastomonas natatoria]|uniref:preprotein translocase subunit SecG n=1 Tax=Blastomonas natatoria TaxID=34015 RepID=UPI000D76B815|nr:preprotein translocase subunit SecG [Blastomonas natatoria]